MQIFSGKIRLIVLAILIAGIGSAASAQTNATQAASDNFGATNATVSPSTPATPSADGANSRTSSLDYLYNHKAADGSVAKEIMDANGQIKTDALSEDAIGESQIDDPVMKRLFGRYLGAGEVPAEQVHTYLNQVQTVLDLLKAGKTTDAWQQLYALAKFQNLDAGVSWELGNRIESIWNANATRYQTARENQSLQKKVDTADYNVDMMSDDAKNKEIEYQRKLNNVAGRSSSSSRQSGTTTTGDGQGSNSQNTTASQSSQTGVSTAPPSDQLLGKLQLTQEYLTSLQAQAQIKINQLKMDKLFEQAKSDFADYITTLYKTGRYQHVILAAQFWRQIFNQGDYPVAMAEQVNSSLEINSQVMTSIDVFNRDMQQKNVSDASNQIQQAFVLSPFNPAVLGVPLEKKSPVKKLGDELSRMKNMIQARDFTNLQTMLTEIKGTAPDFDSTKAMAIVNSAKLESQLRLGKAKLDAQQGDLKQAMDDFHAAAESWPDNPDLKTNATSFFSAQDSGNQAVSEFDRLAAANDYRGIAEKQIIFGPALKDDPKRLESLKAALKKTTAAETAIEKATLMEANGDVDGAWETVQLAIKDLPNDNKLNSLRGDLAGKGADFVAAVNKAQEAEKRGDLGFSLSWYAVAQRVYPASQLANQGIDRLSKTILAKASL